MMNDWIVIIYGYRSIKYPLFAVLLFSCVLCDFSYFLVLVCECVCVVCGLFVCFFVTIYTENGFFSRVFLTWRFRFFMRVSIFGFNGSHLRTILTKFVGTCPKAYKPTYFVRIVRKWEPLFLSTVDTHNSINNKYGRQLEMGNVSAVTWGQF